MSSFYDLSDVDQAERLTELARTALALWDGGFDDPILFKNRENAVFSVLRDDGTRVALRVHRAGYHSDAALRSELYWMRELDRFGIPVPAVVPAADGSLFVHVGAPGIPEVRQVDMIGWLAGAAANASDEGFYRRLGELAGRLHEQGGRIALPDDFERHSWDEEGLLGANPIWGRFLDLSALTDDQRDLLREASRQAVDDLAAYGKSADRFGIIHGDLIRDNVLQDGERLQAIDFDDSGFGWYMFELATIICANLDSDDLPALQAQLFAGYRSIRPLSNADMERLPLFLFLRASTYLGWLQTRSETQTAREKGPMHIARCCRLARNYLEERTIKIEGQA